MAVNDSSRLWRRGLAASRWLCILAIVLTSRLTGLSVADDPAAPESLGAVSKYITLTSPIDEQLLNWVRETGLALQQEAIKSGRKAVLILEVTPGGTPFHQVYGLADFLTSSAISRVTTVAWIPETVVGNNAVVALACREIVMHPDAQLGDIGRGQAVPEDQRNVVLSLVDKRLNPKLSRGLAIGMLNPEATVVHLTIEPAEGVTEKRLVTDDEAMQMRDAGVVIRESRTVKDAGQPGLFSGQQARSLDVLVVQTVETRPDLAALYNLPSEALREPVRPGTFDRVSLIEVKGTIDPLLESFLERQIERAVADGAKLVVFEIDSPGGLLWQSRDLAYAIADLEERDIRTVAFVPAQALSGAAIIALGCDEIYLTPGGLIGDAGPIELRAGGQFERAPEKILSFLREILRELGERKGRPPSLLMAMADKDLRVYEVTHAKTGETWFMSDEELHEAGEDWRKGRMVAESAEGLLLTLNGKRAHELKVTERPVTDFEELKTRLGIPEGVEPRRVERTWLDDTVFVLNTNVVTGLLFFIGLICIYLELHFMSGFLGIIAALCFSLFFWSKFLGGTAGWLEVVLFILGISFLALEMLVIPGFGVFGVCGGLLVFGALVMASQTFGNLEPDRDFREAMRTMGVLSTSIISVILMAVALSRFLPRIPLLNEMILTPPGMANVRSLDEPRLRPDLTETGPQMRLIGQQGTTLTALRPAGKARIGCELLDVVSDGPYIGPGSTVEVVQVSRNRIVVREA